jgi:hypothetical protein
MVSPLRFPYTDAYACFWKGRDTLHLFLLIIAVVLLLVTLASFKQMFSFGARNLFAQIDGKGESNGARQMVYALTGLFLLFVLTVMKVVQPLTLPGIIVTVDSLLFLYACYAKRNQERDGLVRRYYQSGFGLYFSALLQIVFLVASLLFLL